MRSNFRAPWSASTFREIKKIFHFPVEKQSRFFRWPAVALSLDKCFSTAGPRPGTGPWHQLYRAARSSPGLCHFSFLSIFREYIFYSGNILRRIIFLNISKSSNPERLNNICVANFSGRDFISQWLITNLNVILYLLTCHTVYISALILFMITP